MNIARIVKSNSHIDYVARVNDALDAGTAPDLADYGFGQFVSLPQKDGSEVIGVIYNSELVNPDYANYGPRLAPEASGRLYTPDVYFEQGTLISIMLLGQRGADGINSQTMPRSVTQLNQDVRKMDDEAVVEFHRSSEGSMQIHYYSQVIGHAGTFSLSLLESIIEQLLPFCDEAEKGRLEVLRQSLSWQRTMGSMRL